MVLTVYGIETTSRNRVIEYHSQVSTIPTVYGMHRRVRDSKVTMRSAHLLPERREGKTEVRR